MFLTFLAGSRIHSLAGILSKANAWPSTVGVVAHGTILCKGTAIHPRLVITAAHCIMPGTS